MDNSSNGYDPKKKPEDDPPFTGIRKWMRNQLLQHVKAGIHTVASIQVCDLIEEISLIRKHKLHLKPNFFIL